MSSPLTAGTNPTTAAGDDDDAMQHTCKPGAAATLTGLEQANNVLCWCMLAQPGTVLCCPGPLSSSTVEYSPWPA